MREYFVFDGKPSTDFNVGISGSGTYKKPARRVTKYTVPGRNGDLTVSDGSFENVTITYPAYTPDDAPENLDAIAAWLTSKVGYFRLEDTYHKEHFRLAQFTGGIEPSMGTLNLSATYELTFDCDGRLFLKSGERFFAYTEADYAENWRAFGIGPGVDCVTVVNPTPFDSRPLLYVKESGLLLVNDTEIELTGSISAHGATGAGNEMSETADWIVIDCETEEVYLKSDPTVSYNANVIVKNGFPKLRPGENFIVAHGRLLPSIDYQRFAVVPRWHIL